MKVEAILLPNRIIKRLDVPVEVETVGFDRVWVDEMGVLCCESNTEVTPAVYHITYEDGSTRDKHTELIGTDNINMFKVVPSKNKTMISAIIEREVR